MNTKKIILLDCTLRDGGYYNSWDFSSNLINDYLIAMSAISVNYVELGFRSLESNDFKGGCAFTTDSFIEDLEVPNEVKLGVMLNAKEIVNHEKGVIHAITQLFKPAAKSPISFVRIASSIDEFEQALPASTTLKDMGYEVCFNLMQIADRSQEEIKNVAYLAKNNPIDVLYFADSMGSMSPEQTSNIVSILRSEWDGALGIHTHDNMGQALANSLRAVDEGVTWIDGTVTGMGRGPGNVKTEYLAIELADRQNTSLNITPLLSLISKYFKPLKAKYNWGANSYYYLAGKYGIHPSFVQEMLSDTRYDDVDLITVLEYLRKEGGKKFNVHTLESGRHFYTEKPKGSWSPANLLSHKEVLIIGSGPNAKRHHRVLESYIYSSKPIVIALNTEITISEELIDIRAASHPVRLLAESSAHLKLPQPLAVPASMLPKNLLSSLGTKKLLDFGIVIKDNTFHFNKNHCVLPSSLVIAYVLAIAASGNASRVLLAGFDGYNADDPRMSEMNNLLNVYQQSEGVPSLLAITPSRYKLPSKSVYSMV
jgi:4-hydroxy 2-oxovalerate aldolase